MDPPLALTDLHWLAGLLEGEGSFMTGPPSSPGLPVIAVNMTDQDVMARIGQIFERKVHVVRPRNVHWRTSYQVRVNGRAAVRWMTVLRPLMGLRRQAQIDRALASYAPRPVALLTDEAARAALHALAGRRVSSPWRSASASPSGASTTFGWGAPSNTWRASGSRRPGGYQPP